LDLSQKKILEVFAQVISQTPSEDFFARTELELGLGGASISNMDQPFFMSLEYPWYSLPPENM